MQHRLIKHGYILGNIRSKYLFISITKKLDKQINKSFIKKINSPREYIAKTKVATCHLKKAILMNMHLIIVDL